jgi:murein DD-endopeptidase MepM/ murein hydrolase activator NlpD
MRPAFSVVALGLTIGVACDGSIAIELPGVAPLAFAFPLAEPELFGQVLGVDHDPNVYEGVWRVNCADYEGRAFPWCYDEHDGVDYLLEAAFEGMAAGSTDIWAAFEGTVIDTEDGHYDLCHGDVETGEVDCDGFERTANSVIVEHTTGYRTLYWHLQKDSVSVAVGDWVEAGDVLGRVGSSGNSTTPHLHFEVQDASGESIDPYAGPESHDESWWCDQGDSEGLPGYCG